MTSTHQSSQSGNQEISQLRWGQIRQPLSPRISASCPQKDCGVHIGAGVVVDVVANVGVGVDVDVVVVGGVVGVVVVVVAGGGGVVGVVDGVTVCCVSLQH